MKTFAILLFALLPLCCLAQGPKPKLVNRHVTVSKWIHQQGVHQNMIEFDERFYHMHMRQLTSDSLTLVALRCALKWDSVLARHERYVGDRVDSVHWVVAQQFFVLENQVIRYRDQVDEEIRQLGKALRRDYPAYVDERRRLRYRDN